MEIYRCRRQKSDRRGADRAGEALVHRLELLAKRLGGLLDLFDSVRSFAEENRANDFVSGTHEIGFTFCERAPDQTRLFGRLAEQRGRGIFAIEVTAMASDAERTNLHL